MRLGGLDDPRSSPIEDFFWCVQRESGCWRSKSRSRGYEGISNPMVPIAQRGRSTGCLLSLIWPKCLALHWAPHAWRLLDRIGFWGAHPCFYWQFGFRGKRDKAMLSIDIIGHVLRSMVKSEAENDRKTEFLRTSIRGSSLCGDKELVVAASASGSVSIGEVQSPSLQGEYSRSGLSWLCMSMTLLKALLCERGLSPGWKPKVYDRATMMLMHRFVLEDIVFGEAELLVLSLVV
jgi:hypothetical protein